MQPLVKDFPTKALGILLDKVRGREVDNALLAQAALTVLSYGAYTAFGDGEKTVAWGSSDNEEFTLSSEQVLELALNGHADGEAKGGIAFSLVVTVAMAIIQKYLAAR